MFSLRVVLRINGSCCTYPIEPTVFTTLSSDATGISFIMPLMRQDFPAPTGPQTATTSPLNTVKSNFERTKVEPPDPIRNDADVRVRGGEAVSVSVPLHEDSANSFAWTSLPPRELSVRAVRSRKAATRLRAEKACPAPGFVICCDLV